MKRRPPRDVAAGVPICGFTGINGAGKTMLAVESAIADMARGRDVYSTVPITSTFGTSKPILSLRQLLTLQNATILLDEVSVIFSSRSSQSLPPEIVAMLQTVRHAQNTVRWTAPAWMRCDNLLREVTQGLVNVVPMLRRREGANPWPRPRVVIAGLLDTSSGKTDATPTKVLRRRLFIPSRLHAFGAYDTHADTPLLGRHLQGGRCVDCGGTVTAPKHDEKRHDELGLPWYGDDDDPRSVVRRARLQHIDSVSSEGAQNGRSNHGPQHEHPDAETDDSEYHRHDQRHGHDVHAGSLSDRPDAELERGVSFRPSAESPA